MTWLMKLGSSIIDEALLILNKGSSLILVPSGEFTDELYVQINTGVRYMVSNNPGILTVTAL